MEEIDIPDRRAFQSQCAYEQGKGKHGVPKVCSRSHALQRE